MIMKKQFTIRINLLLMSLVLATGSLFSQQDPLYSMYMWNGLAVNPAYAGSVDAISTTILSRHQWVGLDGAPSTQVLSIHSPLPNDNVGLGFTVVNDKIGPLRNLQVWGDFAYRIQTTEKARLSFGLRAGFDVYQANLSQLDHIDPNDPAINKDVDGSLLPNFGLGAYYYSDKGYVGIASPSILENEMNKGNNSLGSAKDLEARHYMLMAGYVLNLSSDSAGIKFRPSVMLRMIEGDAPVSFDLTAMFLFKDRLWLGASYRHEDAVSALVSFEFTDHLRAGYAYDFGISALNDYHNGSHEIMIGYDFFKADIKTRSPRFF